MKDGKREGKEKFFLLLEMFMKESSKIIKRMVKGYIHIVIKIYMKANIKMEKFMEKGNILM